MYHPEYVICYAKSLSTPNRLFVLTEHYGSISLPYGYGCEVSDAIRVLYDETGIIPEREYIREAGRILTEDGVYHVMDCPFRGPYEFEKGRVFSLEGALRNPLLEPCMKLALPLLFINHHGWSMVERHGCWEISL